MNPEFDRKLGSDFISSVPDAPGVYVFRDSKAEIIYVGKAKNLRRRLQQYRLADRKKAQRKMRMIVKRAASVSFEICTSETEALLRENFLIQTHRPSFNVAGAYSFLYPYLGFKVSERLISFCHTTKPEEMERLGFQLWGAFRSRDAVSEAYESIVSLLGFLAHVDHSERDLYREVPYTSIHGFRQLEFTWEADWRSFFSGESSRCLDRLVESLLEKPRARQDAAAVQLHLKILRFFFVSEAKKLRLAMNRKGLAAQRIAQAERDQLFISLEID